MLDWRLETKHQKMSLARFCHITAKTLRINGLCKMKMEQWEETVVIKIVIFDVEIIVC